MVGAAALAGAALAHIPSPASAHDFRLVLVRSDEPTSIEAQRGFRLAVDQSPDVSHPEGEDAGDHLGGVDVNLTEIQAGPAAAREVDDAIRGGASVVVLLVDDADIAGGVSKIARERKVVLVMPLGAPSSPAPGSIVLRSRAAAEGEPPYQAFANDYTESAGAPPTADAVSGYDAGLLIDDLIFRLGEHLRPGAELARRANEAAAQLIGSEVHIPAMETAAEDAAPASSREGPPIAVTPLVVVALIALGVGGSAAVRRQWRRRRSWLRR